jgi:hypothetical protein
MFPNTDVILFFVKTVAYGLYHPHYYNGKISIPKNYFQDCIQ